ncbi:MAG: hypothetical protein ACD_76C00023G0003 [uncultured bacterium]|nr:MAG: hypothetical protein ACD_76C00023G0003 [uncultured bacterium]HBD05369.1 hypothetical protein [Candidatus Uhrbacteria bacterium]
MKFTFTALSKAGRKTRGVVDARNRSEAMRSLRGKGLEITSLLFERAGRHLYIFGGVTAVQKIIFTKHLSVMLKAGVNISRALEILETQARGRMKIIISEIRKDVESGKKLADALAAFPKEFNEYFTNLVRAGEESGNLEANLAQLAIRFSKDHEIKQKALSAMIYPAIVLTLTGGLGLLIALFVFPRLSGLFAAFNFELPLITRILLFTVAFITGHIGLFIVFIILFVALVFVFIKSKATKKFAHALYLRIPVVKTIAFDVNISRFTNALSSLLEGSIPIDKSLLITQEVISNEIYKIAIKKVHDHVEAGEPFAEMLAQNPHLFPPFVSQMIQIGEETGRLEEMLGYISEYYETELDTTLKNLSVIIEPVLLIFIGVIVLGIALAVISPIYNFLGQIG